jgi:hypothetical protein
MSGCGRKHRAKHITREYLDDDSWFGPQGKEEIAVSLESPHGKHVHVYIVKPPTTSSFAPVDHLLSMEKGSAPLIPQVIHLPGKFQKVIWIAAKDVIVVLDGALHRKPSPAQLVNFLSTSPEWKKAIQDVVDVVACERNGGVAAEVVAVVAPPLDGVDMDLMNPNRNNIRHQQAYFGENEGDDEDDEDAEEEQEDEEVGEECEEKEGAKDEA